MYIVFANFDEGMLDLDEPSAELARSALHLVQLYNVPLILMTEKTALEAQMLRMKYFSSHPFIVEDGAAVYVPLGCFDIVHGSSRRDGLYEVIEFGTTRGPIGRAIADAARQIRCKVRLLDDLGEQDIVGLAGVSPERAGYLRSRRYSTAFECTSTRAAQLVSKLSELGLAVSKQGSLYLVFERSAANRAFRYVLDLFTQKGGSATPAWLDFGLSEPFISELFAKRLQLWRSGARDEEHLLDAESWRRDVLDLLESSNDGSRNRPAILSEQVASG